MRGAWPAAGGGLGLVLLCCTAAEGYVGPGAGFAFFSAFLLILVSSVLAVFALLSWPIRWMLRALVRGRRRRRGRVPVPEYMDVSGLVLPFRTRTQSSLHLFRAYLFSPGSENPLNVAEDRSDEAYGWSVVATTSTARTLSQVRARPPVITPNGDGVNDYTVIEFAVDGPGEHRLEGPIPEPLQAEGYFYCGVRANHRFVLQAGDLPRTRIHGALKIRSVRLE